MTVNDASISKQKANQNLDIKFIWCTTTPMSFLVFVILSLFTASSSIIDLHGNCFINFHSDSQNKNEAL